MAKDIYHNLVKAALQQAGWTITHDPLPIETTSGRIEVDLGAEQLIGAVKGSHKIAVNIKSFVGRNLLQDFYGAYGQFSFYYAALEITEPERELYLAVPEDAYKDFLHNPIPQELLKRGSVSLIVFNRTQPAIKQWISVK